MAADIVIPEMGESVRTGVIARWLKADGASVNRDDPVLELETDKITAEVAAPAAGRLRHGAAAGATVNVGAVVGRVEDGAGAASATPVAAPAPGSSAASASASAASPAAAGAAASGAVTPVGAATAAGAAGAAAHGSGGGDDVRATPLARKVADEHGVSVSGLQGTGPGGRVREQDVLAALRSRGGAPAGAAGPALAPAPAAVSSPGATTGSAAGARAGVRRERLSPLRQRLAQRLVEAQHAAAMLTTFNEIDMAPAMALRSRYKEEFEKKHGVGLGFMSFFVKAAAAALQRHPLANASIIAGAGGGLEVEYHDGCDIAIAVSTPKGLTVPVLRGCEKRSFAEIESGIKDLATRARDGKLSMDDLTGGTFTITNGGVFGSLMSTPILNPPQSAILGMHTIKNRPVENPEKAGEIVLRPMMYVALSYDHRLLDGSDAVTFLVAIKNAIERPERLLLGL